MNADYCTKGHDYFSKARTEIEPLLPSAAERVLEIGCGSGATLAWLKRRYACGETVGVELLPDAARMASAIADRVHCLDVEQQPIPAEAQTFDLILCLDVLEHLRDPWRVLHATRELLKRGAVLVVSLPNVRYWRVVLDLVAKGKWAYSLEGVLDRTHLRFFTRAGGKAMLEECGYIVTRVIPASEGQSRFHRILGRFTFGLLREFTSRQYLYRAVVSDERLTGVPQQ